MCIFIFMYFAQYSHFYSIPEHVQVLLLFMMLITLSQSASYHINMLSFCFMDFLLFYIKFLLLLLNPI